MVLDVNSGGWGLVPGLPRSKGAENMAEKNVKIKVIKACYIDGEVRNAGDVLTVSEPLSRELAWMKKAEPVKPEPAPPPPAKAPEPAEETKGKSKEKKGGEDK
jgi:hypothetical protein